MLNLINVVSALAIDHSGSRVHSGSYDYTVRMPPYRICDSPPHRHLSIKLLLPLLMSPTADRFLCVSGSAMAKLLQERAEKKSMLGENGKLGLGGMRDFSGRGSGNSGFPYFCFASRRSTASSSGIRINTFLDSRHCLFLTLIVEIIVWKLMKQLKESISKGENEENEG